MARNAPVVIDGITYYFHPETIARINRDGTFTCRDCGNRLPPTTDPRLRKVNILWEHNGTPCRATEADLSR